MTTGYLDYINADVLVQVPFTPVRGYLDYINADVLVQVPFTPVRGYLDYINADVLVQVNPPLVGPSDATSAQFLSF
jgi:hypothetical protein